MKINLFELAMQTAKKRSDCSLERRSFFIGAVGIRHDGVVVTARNEATRGPSPSGHAEARLLRKLGKYAPVVYVARYCLGNHQSAIAKPCTTCMQHLINKRVKRVYYTVGPNQWEYLDLE